MNPLLLAMKSRRVLVALSALLLGLVTLALPELAIVRAEMLVLIITLALALIGGYTIEDAARIAREAQTPTVPREQLRELIEAVLDELAGEPERPQ